MSPNIHLRKIRRTIILLLTLAISHGSSLNAEDQQQKEALVRAAYIYNFCLFVEWPKAAFRSEVDDITIGIAGRDSFINAVTEAVRGKTAQGRSFKLLRVNTIAEARRTQVLFLGFSEMTKNEAYFAALRDSPIMTFGDDVQFAEKGGIVRLFFEEGRVQYEINLESAKMAHIEFQARLLALARLTRKP